MSGGENTDDLGGPLQHARVGVLLRLAARRCEIEETIFARVRDAAPDRLGFADPEYVAGLRAAVVAAVDYVLSGLEQVGPATPQIPGVAVAQARRAARAGVGLDTVLRRYVVGLAVIEDFLMQEADHSDLLDQRTVLRGMLETSASLLGRLIPSVTNAYMQELGQPGSSPLQGSDRTDSARGSRSSKASHGQVARAQRARISKALVEVLAERGFAGATVALVLAQAKVSRRTFYELFCSLEDCLITIMDGVLEQVGSLALAELQREEHWGDGVRCALAAVLAFFDREPQLARVCIVETLAGGPVVLEHRERIIEAFRAPIVTQIEREVPDVPPLAAEWVITSVLGMMHAHIVVGKPGPFIDMLGPLMGLVTAPSLDARGVQGEIKRGDELAQTILAGHSRWTVTLQTPEGEDASAAPASSTLPALLANPSARRARECVLFLAENPDCSNREIAVGINVAHLSQISKLLSDLIAESLVIKHSQGAGKRNAWRLTPRGEEIARTLTD